MESSDAAAPAGAIVTYRSATPSDVDAVLALWHAAGAHPTVTDTAEALGTLLDADALSVLLAESGGALVGSLIAGWNGWRGSLYRLAVHPSARRRGVARELVRRAVERLRERGAQRIDAFVVAGDHAAVAFWDSLGGIGVVRDEAKVRYVSQGPSAHGL